jgi:transposase
MAMELSNEEWKLHSATVARNGLVSIRRETGTGWKRQSPRQGEAGPAGGCARPQLYEAGRDGFWIHRMLERMGVANVVGGFGEHRVNRRSAGPRPTGWTRRKLLAMLLRYRLYGERKTWSVVRVAQRGGRRPSPAPPERGTLKKERKQHLVRMKSAARAQRRERPAPAEGLGAVRDWAGRPCRRNWSGNWNRNRSVWTWWLPVERAGAGPAQAIARREERAKQPGDGALGFEIGFGQGRRRGYGVAVVARVLRLGMFNNRREVGRGGGLTGSPIPAGTANGTRHRRRQQTGGHLMTELAWRWLRFQPEASWPSGTKTLWRGTKRARRVGIVALARKLLIALWRYGAQGVVPDGVSIKAA